MTEKIATITCLKELNKRRCLEFYDKVVFTTNEEEITYEVGDNYLNNTGEVKSGKNDKIFRILKLKKYEIAEKAYGYKVISDISDWPTSEHEDYPALTRLVRKLYTIIEKRDIKYTKYNRFEIMDI